MDQSFVTAADLSVLHDAELCLVDHDRGEARLRLGFKGTNQEIHMISFRQILTVKIDNFQYQNVVSRVLASNAEDGFSDDIERIVRWISSSSADRSSPDRLLISEQNMQTHLARIRAGGLHLLYVEPSWGAEVGVIAEAIHVSNGSSG